jgi:hypothetical protein
MIGERLDKEVRGLTIYSKQDFENEIRRLLEEAGFLVSSVEAVEQHAELEHGSMTHVELKLAVSFNGLVCGISTH